MVATNEQVQLHTLLSQLILVASLPTYIVTRYLIVAPFGRHVPKQQHDKQKGQSKYHWWFGPSFNARMSWFLFESPNLIWSLYCCWYWCDPNIFFLDDPSETSQKRTAISLENNHLQISTNVILMSLFALHYINRAIIYPLRMNSNSQKVPLLVTVSASLITIWNGYLQCFYLVQIEMLSPLTLSSSLDNIQRWAGIGIFFLGMGINIHSDGVLRNLRRHGPTGKLKQKQVDLKQQATKQQHAYYIPYSPFFTSVSCPNFAGEIFEWLGFSMASQFSLPSVAFAVYTASNLIPRAIAHHDWYKTKFDDYPVERKAVIPFII
mmetsp:Transcript_3124/g.6883  ORF Transcript_3124/g.6883 Transcript_3124/m.6883 type:complete len:321 (-) Transcript_3124:241-1203(-)|eukprot:CAMPEP_0172308540 /NCGR_PEP_ID=MMETSP1058-20130122/9097_1 /TAXON_ID=83371 /ORGANISM="Detonula confervacea, Strain CCMP 353" /LENGTH=320 /DNA_ID=CAMNT_0013020977 /DNA_START=135 /DNA_END=1097 /DNA_ORIENTATION=+